MPKFATKIRAFGLLVGGFLLIQTWNNFEKMVHFCFLLLEKSAPLPIVTVVTNMSYGLWVSNYITMQSGCIWRLSFHYHQLQNDSHNNTKEGEKNATMVS